MGGYIGFTTSVRRCEMGEPKIEASCRQPPCIEPS